jgi:type I restriction enzyme S subunit
LLDKPFVAIGQQLTVDMSGRISAFVRDSAWISDVWVTAADYNQPGIVISAVGARCGKTFFAEGEWTTIANTQVLLPGQDIEPRWLWYRTNDEDFWIRGGTAQPFVKVRETLR